MLIKLDTDPNVVLWNLSETLDETDTLDSLTPAQKAVLRVQQRAGAAPDLRWRAGWPGRESEQFFPVWISLVRDDLGDPCGVWIGPFDEEDGHPDARPLREVQHTVPDTARLCLGPDVIEQTAGTATVHLVRGARAGLRVRSFLSEAQCFASARFKVLRGGTVEVPLNDVGWDTWEPKARTVCVWIWAAHEDAAMLADRLKKSGRDVRIIAPPTSYKSVEGWLSSAALIPTTLDLGLVRERW